MTFANGLWLGFLACLLLLTIADIINKAIKDRKAYREMELRLALKMLMCEQIEKTSRDCSKCPFEHECLSYKKIINLEFIKEFNKMNKEDKTNESI